MKISQYEQKTDMYLIIITALPVPLSLSLSAALCKLSLMQKYKALHCVGKRFLDVRMIVTERIP